VSTYISLFSSAGVGCFGLKEEGFSCAATAELIERRLDIQKTNNKCKYDTGYISGDITDLSIQSKLYDEIEFFKKKEKIKQLDLVVATPPCQGMSVANHKKGNELNRNSLVIESIKIVDTLRPKYFIFENVSSFLKSICTDLDGVDKPIYEAIESNLGANYAIESKIINFKNYGSNSSRTRTLVIGVNKSLKEITPLDLFPTYRKERTLKQVIGDFNPLETMGEFDPNDIYHSFRPYKEHMFPWISATPYGQSAFDNPKDSLKPHKIVDGNIVVNQNKNGDKYQRQLWEKVAPCIHTRNDCLPSQNTVHPVDNRVFSIRELMKIMTIPNTFKWVKDENLPLNSASYNIKAAFRKKTEFNIRQCIGEAVPTAIFASVARNIKSVTKHVNLTTKVINGIISEFQLTEFDNLITFVENNASQYSRVEMFKVCELANSKRLDTAAYYTRQDICYSIVESLPQLKKKIIRILEPSVGVGNFLYLLAEKYSDKTVIVDCVDINEQSITLCRLLAEKFLPSNISLNFIHADFLLSTKVEKVKYDIVIGNPPYMKLKGNPKLLKQYQLTATNSKTNNVFSFFIEKSLRLGNFVSLIVPKALINSPEYSVTRDILSKMKLIKVIDYNEKAFDVKIETLSFAVETKRVKKEHNVIIESYLKKQMFFQDQEYITKCQFDSWFLYRNDFFDDICKTLEFGVFKVFRDRQLTKANSYDIGDIRVIKARNIGNNEIINIDGYDKYIKKINGYAVGKYLNTDAILVPNLTYNPRAARLPKDCVADGSAAILVSERDVSDQVINYFSSDEFNQFYRIARNYNTRSMNIDSVSVNYFGVKRAI